MPAKSEDLKIVIEAINKATKQLQQVEDDLKNLSDTNKEGGKQAEKAAAGMQSLVGGVAKGTIVAQAAMAAFQKLTSAIKNATKSFLNMVMAASEVEGLGIAMKVVANNAGITADEVARVRDAVIEQNVTTEAANRLMTDLIRNQLDYTQATKLAAAAQNIAVASGKDSSDTIERISYAISSGNTWRLRQLGLVKHLDAVYEDYGKTLGKSSEQMTEVERKQAIVNYVLQQGEKYTGAYENAMGNAAKKMRSVKARFEEISYTIGKVFNDAMYEVIATVYDLVDGIVDFAHENQDKLRAIGSAVAKWAKRMVSSITSWFNHNKKVIYDITNFIIKASMKMIGAMRQVINVVQILINGLDMAATTMIQTGKILVKAAKRDWEGVSKAWKTGVGRTERIVEQFEGNVVDIVKAEKGMHDATTFDLKEWWNDIEGIQSDGWEDRLKEQKEGYDKMSEQQKEALKKMREKIEEENEKYAKKVKRRTEDFQEKFDRTVLEHKKAIEELTKDLKSENKEYKKELDELEKDYQEAMESIKDDHAEKVKDVKEQMREEREATEEEIEKIKEAYMEERTLIEREGEDRLNNLQAQLDKELVLGENANQEKIDNLKEMISKEQKGLDRALSEKKQKYEEEKSDLNEKLNEKISALQSKLDKEDRLYDERLKERKLEYKQEVQAAKAAYEEKRRELQKELDKELEIRKKFKEDFDRLKNKTVQDDLTRMVQEHEKKMKRMEEDHKEKLAEIKENAYEEGKAAGEQMEKGWQDSGVDQTIENTKDKMQEVQDLATGYSPASPPGAFGKNPYSQFVIGGGGGGGGGGGAFQKGGLATRPGVVGESGPEVVLPLDFPKRMANIMQSMGLGGNKGRQVTQNFYVTVEKKEDVDVLMERAGFAYKQGGGFK